MDNVSHPSHYADNCSMECIESMLIAFSPEQVFAFCLCNAYKYLWRHKFKNGAEDLKKANWYIDKAESLNHRYGAIQGQFNGAEKIQVLKDTSHFYENTL